MSLGGTHPDFMPWNEGGDDLDALTSADNKVRVTDEWEYVDWTLVVTPQVVLPDGNTLATDVAHDDIDQILIRDAIPCATYKVRFVAGQAQYGVAAIEEMIAPPADGDLFRLGIDTVDDVPIEANESLIQTYREGLSNTKVTVEIKIRRQGNKLGCRLHNPGMALYEGVRIPVTKTDTDNEAKIRHDHESIPDDVVQPRITTISYEGTPSDDDFIVEITNAGRQGKVVDGALDDHNCDARWVEFDVPVDDFDTVRIYLCGRPGDNDTSTCQECHEKELFGGNSPKGTEAGDLLLLKDYKRDLYAGNDDEVYGPFKAKTDEQRNIDANAWDGYFSHQVKVEHDELFMLQETQLDIDIAGKDQLTGVEATQILSQLVTEGVPIEIGQDGNRQVIDKEPNHPEEDDHEQETDEEDDSTDDEEDEDGDNSSSSTASEDARERLTTILMAKNQTRPLPTEDLLADASNPGAPLIEPAYNGELRPELYEKALAHLIAGKNIILYGPPGSGKTRIAKRLGQTLCSNLHVAAANAEWSYQEVVGGYAPAEAEGFEPTKGVLTTAAECCRESLADYDHPEWLLIDELNRANLDEAFGDVFTLLDIDHRAEDVITYADEKEQPVPLSFRILGTMNTEDQSQLFALGYAFRRRFAFLEVPPAYEQDTEVDSPAPNSPGIELNQGFERLLPIVEEAVMDHFEDDAVAKDIDEEITDTQLGVPPIATVVNSKTLLDDAIEAISPPGEPIEFSKAIMWFVQKLAENEVADIGQGIIIDALKFVVAHYLLFPTETDWGVVDEAVEAYLLPQLESYTSDLRRAETVAADSDAVTNFKAVKTTAANLGLPKTEETLEVALEEHEILR